MSYAEQVREEIFSQKPSKQKYYKSFCFGLLLMGRRFDNQAVAIYTEHLTVSKLYGFAINDCCRVRADYTVHKSARGTQLYSVTLTDPSAIARLMNCFDYVDGDFNPDLLAPEALPSFLTGAFLACGSISEPDRAYRLEFVPPSESLCDLLFEQLCHAGYPPKCGTRRGQTLLYFNDSSQIEDLLALMGAVRCSLELMETKIYKDLRNRANRATNCETANIDKMVRAAVAQVADIELLEQHNILSTLPVGLIAAADARRENPDASLAEIAEILGISRSGANHRLTKLSQIARDLRGEKC